jgi:hypothetical protein
LACLLRAACDKHASYQDQGAAQHETREVDREKARTRCKIDKDKLI